MEPDRNSDRTTEQLVMSSLEWGGSAARRVRSLWVAGTAILVATWLLVGAL